MPTKHDTNCLPSGCHFDDRPHVYSILHSELWFKLFVLFSTSWSESKGKKNIAAGSLSTKKCRLSLLLKRKGNFAEPLQEEETNRVRESFTPDNTVTGHFAFHVS